MIYGYFTKSLYVLLALTGMSFNTKGLAEEKKAASIVEKADEIRFPNEDFVLTTKVTTQKPNKDTIRREYKVLSKGIEKSIVITTAPASERGQILLMKDRDLWAFMPSVSQPIRLSLSQRLTGLVANGDLARAQFKKDYKAKLVGEKKGKNAVYYELELTAVDESVTYRRVQYWVNKKNYRPYKAKFYSISGKLLKTCWFKDFKRAAGKVRPMRLLIADSVTEGYKSILEYTKIQKKSLEDKLFSKLYLKKIDPLTMDY